MTLSVLPVGLATLPVAACVHFGMVRLALSHVGVENSREILAVETADTSFDASVTAAEARWEAVFSRIDVEGVSDAERRV